MSNFRSPPAQPKVYPGLIMKGFVYAPVGGGGPLGTEAWKKANVKILTDLEQCGEISGFSIYETLLCQVTKEEKTQIHG